MQRYVLWAALGLVGYTFFMPLAQIATRQIPSTVLALFTNSILALSALVIVLLNYQNPTQYVTVDLLPYIVGAGAFLTVGILAYYRALSLGPISVVTPIFGISS